MNDRFLIVGLMKKVNSPGLFSPSYIFLNNFHLLAQIRIEILYLIFLIISKFEASSSIS